MDVYIVESGTDCEGGNILGVYSSKKDAREAILTYINIMEYENVKKINDDYYEIGGYQYVSVRKFTVQ